MPPAIPRLKRRAEFLRVAGAKRKWAMPGLVLQARPWKDGVSHEMPEIGFRVGFTVSKKVGKAVARNRARRRLRVVADRVLAAHAKPGFDFVVIGRAATIERPFADLLRDMEAALRRVKAHRGANHHKGREKDRGDEHRDEAGRPEKA